MRDIKWPQANRSFIYVVVLTSLLSANSELRAGEAGPDRLAQAKQAAVVRLDRLQRIAVAFKSVETYRPVLEALPPDVHPYQGSWGYVESFRFFNGRAEYEWEYDSDSAVKAKAIRGPTDVRRQVLVYTFERAESLTQRFDEEAGIGTVSDEKMLPTVHCIEYGLGLRCRDLNEWLTPQTLEKASFLYDESGMVVIKLEAMDKHAKHLVEHKWWLDPNRSYALLKYQSSYAGQKHPFFQALCSDFESIDGLLLPRVVDEQVQSEYKGTLFVPFEEVIQVDNYRINGDDNSQGSYSLQWPSNSSLKDMRTGILLRPPTTRPISDAEIVATVPLRQTSPVTRGWTGAQISLTAVTAILGILTLLYIRRDARKTS